MTTLLFSFFSFFVLGGGISVALQSSINSDFTESDPPTEVNISLARVSVEMLHMCMVCRFSVAKY